MVFDYERTSGGENATGAPGTYSGNGKDPE
jgi:hypothetical protein